MPIDVERDFAPISLMNRESYLVVITPNLPAQSVKEFIALAKAKPGFINAGAGNFGSGTHLITMQFLDAIGVREQTTYIPYNGVSLAFIDAIAGRVQMTVSSIVSVSPHVRTGKLRALATHAVRAAKLPEIRDKLKSMGSETAGSTPQEF